MYLYLCSEKEIETSSEFSYCLLLGSKIVKLGSLQIKGQTKLLVEDLADTAITKHSQEFCL